MILRKPKDRFTTYRQLVLGVSAFDIVSSTAYMLVGVLAPYDAGFYLSRGNVTTCKIQGFMIQLGQSTSMFYNMFLALYFFLVVVRGWRESSCRKIIVWVHVAAVVCSVGLAVGAIPFIEAQFGVCGILPPLTSSQWQVSLFYTAPVSIVLFTLTVSTLAICRSVYIQEKRARKWKFVKKKLSMTREVLWQSFWYVMAFCVTLPMMLVSFYAPFEYPRGFWIFIVTAFLAPLQGLMNALVYFQRAKVWQSSCKTFRCGLVWKLIERMIPRARQVSNPSLADTDQPGTGGKLESGVASVGVVQQPPIQSTNETHSSGENRDDEASTTGQSNDVVDHGSVGDRLDHLQSTEDDGVLDYWRLNESWGRLA